MKQKATNGWKETKLGDYFRIKHGWAFKGEFFDKSGPFVLLTPGNFFDEGGFKFKAEKAKYYTGEVPPDFILSRGDLLVAMTEQAEGLLGSSAIIPESNRYLHNQRLGLIEELKETELDKKFLYYLFNTRSVRAQIRASASGVKVRHTSPSRIYEVKVTLPPASTQRKIASIVSAYDELIENNTRRIKLLEQMAQALYREWFVRPCQSGKLPKGYEGKILGDIAEEVRRTVDPSEVGPETPYFGLEHLPRKSIALTEWGEARQVQSTKHAFKKGEILFGKIRPYFHKVGVAPLDGVCSSDAIVIRPKSPEHFAAVLCCVSSEDFVAHATQTSQGTKMPRANWDVLTKYPIALPPKLKLSQFNGFVEDIVTEIHNLIFKNRNLRRTRDLLLPRLISGEVAIGKDEG